MLKFLKRYWWILLGLAVSLPVFNIQEFIKPFFEAMRNFTVGQWFYRFSTLNEEVWIDFMKKVDGWWEWLREFTYGFDMQRFLIEALNWLISTTYDLLNSLVFVFLPWLYYFIFKFTDRATESRETTKAAAAFFQMIRFYRRILVHLKKALRFVRSQLKYVFRAFLIYAFFRGWLLAFVFEVLIFVWYYILAVARQDSVMLVFSIFKSFVIMLVVYIPYRITALAAVILFWMFTVNSATNRLESNHDALKVFVKYETPFVTIINGPPGIGKTRIGTAFSLAAEENHHDELEQLIHDYESSYPEINWGRYTLAKLVENPTSDYDWKYLAKNHPDYLYWSLLLYESGSLIASFPYAIQDPYNGTNSVVLDLDWIRALAAKTKTPIEPYKILTLDEFDKEYNSHEDKDRVGAEGVHTFFGTGAHLMERHGKMFIMYQIDSQVPLRIRGNSEMFLNITERKPGYPVLLNLFRIPFIVLFSWIDSLLIQHESEKKKITADTRRTFKRFRKCYDVTLPYAVLRFIAVGLARILSWFAKFEYMKYKLDVCNVDKQVLRTAKIFINAQDEVFKGRPLYISTFLRQAFQDARLDDLQVDDKYRTRWARLRRYADLYPNEDELRSMHSNWMNRAYFGIKEDRSVTQSSPDEQDDSPSF